MFGMSSELLSRLRVFSERFCSPGLQMQCNTFKENILLYLSF